MSDHKQQHTDAWRYERSDQKSQRRSLWRYALAMLLLACALAGCRALPTADRDPQADALLDRIWPELPRARQVLSKQDQTYAEAALSHALETYLHREYEVVDQRFFWNQPNRHSWSALGKSHGSLIQNNWSGVLVEQDWSEPGFDQVALWKVVIAGKTHYLAIAMTDQPVSGSGDRHLIGRFELKKLTDKD
jgi:hypothetical protein